MAQSTFESPGELDQFAGEVIQKLHRAELHDAAKLLEDWRSTAYTTSSELLGELGLVIRKIHKQYKINKSINVDLSRLLDEVHGVWPYI
jgi:hypothetical protein